MKSNAHGSLNRHWWGVVTLFGLLLGLSYLVSQNIRWLVPAAIVAAYELWLLRRNLKYNHRQNEINLLPTLGVGNALTLFRGLLLAWLAGFLFSPWPAGYLAFLPFVLYLIAAITDGFDGYLARRTNHTTRLGQILDIEFDALGILVATALAINYGQLPWWFLILGLARYLFVFGIWWRNRQGKPVYALPFSITRRLLAGFQMGFAAAMLWPIFHPPGTILAGVLFAVPFLAIFTRDWLIVSGRIDPASTAYLVIRKKLVINLIHRLPILLRLVAVASAIVILFQPQPMLPITLPLTLATSIMIMLGFAGRLAALGLLLVASIYIVNTGLDFASGLMLSSTITLMLLGTGAFSLWTPEDKFLNRRSENL